VVRRAIASGTALDARSVYFLARLSPRYPTIEVRVADVALPGAVPGLIAAVSRPAGTAPARPLPAG
jgi:glutamate---cysteine ligase / carboxylate-amine ligase